MCAVGQLTGLTQLQLCLVNDSCPTSAAPQGSEPGLDVRPLAALRNVQDLLWESDLPLKAGSMQAMLRGMASIAKLELMLCSALPSSLAWPATLTHVRGGVVLRACCLLTRMFGGCAS